MLGMVRDSDVSIPRVGTGRSGNRPLDRVGSRSGIATGNLQLVVKHAEEVF